MGVDISITHVCILIQKLCFDVFFKKSFLKQAMYIQM